MSVTIKICRGEKTMVICPFNSHRQFEQILQYST